jgi:hypothetical protein
MDLQLVDVARLRLASLSVPMVEPSFPFPKGWLWTPLAIEGVPDHRHVVALGRVDLGYLGELDSQPSLRPGAQSADWPASVPHDRAAELGCQLAPVRDRTRPSARWASAIISRWGCCIPSDEVRQCAGASSTGRSTSRRRRSCEVGNGPVVDRPPHRAFDAHSQFSRAKRTSRRRRGAEEQSTQGRAIEAASSLRSPMPVHRRIGELRRLPVTRGAIAAGGRRGGDPLPHHAAGHVAQTGGTASSELHLRCDRKVCSPSVALESISASRIGSATTRSRPRRPAVRALE